MNRRVLDFRSEVGRLTREIDPGSIMNEVVLLETGIKIYMFLVEGKAYFSVYSVIEMLRYFGNIDGPMDVHEYLRSRGCVERLGKLGGSFENGELEVVCSDVLTNELLEGVVRKAASSREEEMEMYFKQIEMEPLQNFGPGVYDRMPVAPRETFEERQNIDKLYPFDNQWTDNVMDGILRNIYTSDEHEGRKGVGSGGLEMRPGGRGRSMKDAGNLKDRPFVCTYKDCKRAFKRYEHLKRHNLMHTGERPHKCKFPGCSKAFSRSDNLSQHYKIHNVAENMHTKTYDYRYLNKEFN